ncbi:Uu.00g059170.m01.CDS01 [Anthostomella pinea]|uniref:Uu.00g059170.m01.CDS01 n=1 Tax=Anthostomella pinea TaxID=933095 RepID=A0AAI8VT71_9PEZI|nr:Uu.00g059170.m01.CDS01 [Anthostomella pinea]
MRHIFRTGKQYIDLRQYRGGRKQPHRRFTCRGSSDCWSAAEDDGAGSGGQKRCRTKPMSQEKSEGDAEKLGTNLAAGRHARKPDDRKGWEAVESGQYRVQSATARLPGRPRARADPKNIVLIFWGHILGDAAADWLQEGGSAQKVGIAASFYQLGSDGKSWIRGERRGYYNGTG